jgi:peroxiredoxin
MQKFFLSLVVAFAGYTTTAQSLDIPEVSIKDVNGKQVSTSTIETDGKPVVISFWATWCKPCVRELTAIDESYIDWQDETGVKVIAISIDDTRNSAKVAPFVNGRNWEYDVYIDENSDLRRMMGVNNIPHTFLFDGNGKLVYQHNGYAQGDEDLLYEMVQKLARGETIDAH